ncbi:MAG: hypothetical protein MRZ79_15865 [Bacteroidia bacterium]|nr:hypothetical protein [Bacteroidia bacterium]
MSEERRIKLYTNFRIGILILYVLSYLIIPATAPSEEDFNFGFLVIMAFPVFTPFLYSFIFSENSSFHLNLYIASLGIFLTISLAMSPYSVVVFLLGSLVVFLIALGITPEIAGGEEKVYSSSRQAIGGQVQLEDESDNSTHSHKYRIQKKLTEIDLKIEVYQVQLDGLYRARTKRNNYLRDVEERLSYEHLSEENRQVTEKLKESLLNTLDNYKLLIQFFTEAQNLFLKEKKNLEATLGNMEIISFLQQDSPLENVAEIEKTMLQMEFEKHIKEIESELPILKERMLVDSIDLSNEMKKQLEDAIKKLK